MFSLACCSILRKWLRNSKETFEYSKSPEAKKLSVLGPDLSFL